MSNNNRARPFKRLALPLVLTLLSLLQAPRVARALEFSFENDSSLPLVYLNIAFKAGSVTDPQGESGITYFLGQMLLRGTQIRSKEQLDLALDQIGARLEVEVRAESLILRGAVLSSQLDEFLKILREVITQPSFPENEITKLKAEATSQILEETSHDGTLANRKFTRFLFQDHPYGKPIIGTATDIHALRSDRLRKHYEKIFSDRLLLVIGTGNTESSKIESWSHTLASSLPHSTAVSTALATPQSRTSPALLFIDKPDRTQCQIYIGQVGLKMTDPDYFSLNLVNYAFGGGGFNSRLMQELRVKRGWTYGAYSYYRMGTQPRSWQLSLATANKDTAPAITRALQMIPEIKNHGLTQEEFDFSKTSIINSAGFSFDTPKKRVENKLLERSLGLPEGFIKRSADETAKLSLPQVNAAAKEFFKPESLSIAVLGTASQVKDAVIGASGVSPKQVQTTSYTE